MVQLQLLTKFGDGGDSCNRTCAAALGYIYLNDPVNIKFLQDLYDPERPWLWRRSPHEGRWYADWNRMSRDQTIPLLILIGEARLTWALAYYIIGHLFRLMLFTHNSRRNFVYMDEAEHLLKSTPDVPWRPQWKLPDITGPEIWALEIRAMPWLIRTLLLPLLIVFDLETLGGSLIRRLFRKDNCDVINHTLVLINGLRRSPTPIIWLAGKITDRRFLQPRLNRFFEDPGEPKLNTLLAYSVSKYL